ncbi:MAG TPA: metal ABC transporter ATP-binding protein [Candidatus Pacearchaeota archaeon]|nr:metal ABC transporter ATP-binding protein [Candidatus Pacearchaeota archaeon]
MSEKSDLPILIVKNLKVKLENEEIISNLSFELKKGEILTILGPNGAGKTTLLKALLSLIPFEGEIIWQKKIKIGYVPQRLPFIKDVPMSVEDFFKLKNSSKEKIEKIIEEIGLNKDFLNKKIGNLSSGQFQRILIAWALIDDPDVLLFDEPTSGIDISGEETIYSLLEKINKERKLTIILITHDLSVVFKFSDYVICLNKNVICQGEPKEVLTSQNLEKLYDKEIKIYQHHKH